MNPWLCNLLFNNSGGSSLPATGQTFYASLKTSLVPEVGTGGPTWSRATKAWGFNELGYLRELASGCAFFGGARKVYNTLASASSYSENVNVAGWAKSNCTTPSADTVVCAASNSHQRITGGSISTVAGQVFYCSFRATYVDAQFIQARLNWSYTPAYVNFDLLNGTYAGYDGFLAAGMTLVSPGVYDCWCRLATTYTGTGATAIQIQFVEASNSITGSNFNGDGVKSFKITKLSVVDVTGRDASYIPEYVSVGVVASPYFGAGIDGAKYFETDWQGAPIPAANLLGLRRESAATNSLLYSRDLTKQSTGTATRWLTPQSTGAEVVENGSFDSDLTGWTVSVGAGDTISAAGGQLSVIFSGTVGSTFTNSQLLTIGSTYAMTVIASGTGAFKFQAGGLEFYITAGTNTYSFNALVTAINFARIASNACNLIIDSISIKLAQVQCGQTATGLDGLPNTATTLTATAANATILQSITLASADRCASAYVKRRTGSGVISFTQDGGSTWTDITAQINGSTWSRVEITSTLANPSVGFKISTSGDAIDVDVVQNEAGSVATSLIVTTTTAVTRNAESLTYQTSGNIDFTVGTAYARFTASATSVARYVITANSQGSYTNAGQPATSWRAYDGTNVVTATGLDDFTAAAVKRAIAWGGSELKVCGKGVVPTVGAFDGSMGSGATIDIGNSLGGYIGDVAIYNYKMSDAELQAITT